MDLAVVYLAHCLADPDFYDSSYGWDDSTTRTGGPAAMRQFTALEPAVGVTRGEIVPTPHIPMEAYAKVRS